MSCETEVIGRHTARLLAAAALLLVGCGEFTVTVTPTDSALRYEAWILEGSTCPANAEELGEATNPRRVDIENGSDLGSLGPRDHALVVLARDTDCVVRAFGCAVAEPTRRGSVDVVMSTVAGLGCSSAETCSMGRCSANPDPGNDTGGADADAGNDMGGADADVGDADSADADSADADSADADSGADAGSDTGVDEGLPLGECERVVERTVGCASDADCAPPFFTCEAEMCVSAMRCQDRARIMGDLGATQHVDVAIGRARTEMSAEALVLSMSSTSPAAFMGLASIERAAPISHVAVPGVPITVDLSEDERPDPALDFAWPVTRTEANSFTLAREIDGLVYANQMKNGLRASDLGLIGPPSEAFVIDTHAATARAHVVARVSEGQRSLYSRFEGDGSIEWFSADLGEAVITDLVSAASEWVVVRRGDDGTGQAGALGAWDASPETGSPVPYQDLELISTQRPAWAHIRDGIHLLLTTTESATELRQVECDGICAVDPAETLFDFAVQEASFVDLDTGRALVHRTAGVLLAEFLSDSHEHLGTVEVVASVDGAFDAAHWLTATGPSLLFLVGGPGVGGSLYVVTTGG